MIHDASLGTCCDVTRDPSNNIAMGGGMATISMSHRVSGHSITPTDMC
jgi:hypothetical protein